MIRRLCITLGIIGVLILGASIPAAWAHPQLGSGSNPVDPDQTADKTYGAFTLETCFGTDGYTDVEGVFITNQFAGNSSMDWHLQYYRLDTGAALGYGSVVYNIPYLGSQMIAVNGHSASQDWPKKPNGYNIGVRIRMLWPSGTFAEDWFLSPFHQNHTASGHFTEETFDDLNTTNVCT